MSADAKPHDIDIGAFAGELLRVVGHPEAPPAPRKRYARRPRATVLDAPRERLTTNDEELLLRAWKCIELAHAELVRARHEAKSPEERTKLNALCELVSTAHVVTRLAADPVFTIDNMREREARRDARVADRQARFQESQQRYRDANARRASARRVAK